MKKFLLVFIIAIILFFVGLTTFGPWKWYRIPAGQDGLGGTVHVSKLPVWYGSYILRAPTERESDEAYLKELDAQIQRYEKWEDTEVKKNVLKWFKEERERVKKRLDSPDNP
jgi:hypothetical protein